MNTSQKFWACYVIMGFLALVLINLFYIHFGYPFGGDLTLENSTLKTNLYYGFFIWQPNNYSGFISLTAGVLGYVFIIFIFLYKLSLIYGYVLEIAFYATIGLAGMAYLVYDLTDVYSLKIRYFSAVASSVLFSFTFFFTPVAAFIPWLVIFARRLLYPKTNEEGYWKVNLFYMTILQGFVILFSGASYIIQSMTLILVTYLLLIVLSTKKRLLRNASYIITAVLLGILINASWIITTYILSRNEGSAHFLNSGSLHTLSIFAENILQLLFSFGPALQSNGPIALTTFFPLISILTISLFSYLYIKNKHGNYRVVLAIFLTFLICLGAATTIYAPFGPLFQKLVKVFPYILALRYTYTATHYIFLFLVPLLFGVGVATVMGLLSRDKRRYLLILFSVLLIAIMAVYIYRFTYVPIAYGHVVVLNLTKISIPAQTFQIANYINSKTGNFAVATLPSGTTWQGESWYVGVDVYSSLINNRPVYTGGYNYYGEIFIPETEGEYDRIVQEIGNNYVANTTSISNMLGIFGIHYIIVQGHALHSIHDCTCSMIPFNFTYIYTNLNNSNNITLIKYYADNSSIYKNDNYVPLVYGSDLLNLGDATSSNLMNEVGSSSFNIQNTSVYSTGTSGLYNGSNTINATYIANFTKPDIKFTEDNPTQVTVHVYNATTPYYLVFRETYDPHWATFYSNGTEVDPRDHIAVNGFANAWYMNKTGNYTVTLYYTLQTDVWIAWGVSFAALFVAIGIGVYGWKETKKEKMRSRR